MNICYDWIAEIVKVNHLAEKDGKQIESIDLLFEPTDKDELCPPQGWNHMRFNYETIGVEHKPWTYTHPTR